MPPFPKGKMISARLESIAPDSERPIPPCGACRQVISEFASKDFMLHFSGTSGEIISVTIDEILPYDSLHDLLD